MPDKKYLTAHQAAEALNISLPTLYSYVSRGFLRSEAVEGSPRQRRYYAEDVAALQVKRTATPEAIAQSTLHWGTPILDSAITLIKDGHLYYRGHDAVQLAMQVRFEEVACLLWTEDTALTAELFSPENCMDLPTYPLPPLDGFTCLRMMLPYASVEDFAAYTFQAEHVARTGARILRLMVETLIGKSYHGSIAAALASEVADEQAEAWLNAALILCADHELNTSSFAARIAASTGASPYAVVTSGLATLTGYKHGAVTERVAAFLHEVGHPDNAHHAVAQRLRRGEDIPGFGHRLYPDGDPRGTALLGYAAQCSQQAPYDLAMAVIDAVKSITGELPNLDVGLVVLLQCLGMTTVSPLEVFAIGRTAGWLGHAIEQYTSDTIIRPRARYVGIAPLP